MGTSFLRPVLVTTRNSKPKYGTPEYSANIYKNVEFSSNKLFFLLTKILFLKYLTRLNVSSRKYNCN